MKAKVCVGLMVMFMVSINATGTIILENGESSTIADTYTIANYSSNSYVSQNTASKMTGEGSAFFSFVSWGSFYEAYTKKGEYVTDDMSSYMDQALELYIRSDATYTSSVAFYINGYVDEAKTVLGNLMFTMSFGDEISKNAWHDIHVELDENGRFTTVGTMVDGSASTSITVGNGSLSDIEVERLWSNVESWKLMIYSSYSWAGFSNANTLLVDDMKLVPEPATIGILALGSLALLRRKK